jgi:hypothetical protein
MLGVHYAGQVYEGQGYAVTGASVPALGRYGFDLYGEDGSLVLRAGDITGMVWGGSGFTLPPQTYGIWAKRDGVWIKGMPQVFYANATNQTVSVAASIPANPTGVAQISVDETFPFITVLVPQGRMVTWEDFLYYMSVTLTSAVGVTNPLIVNWTFVTTKFLAVRNQDGSLLTWNYMTGPPTVGTNRFDNIVLRRLINIQISGTDTAPSSWVFSVQRISAIRMFSHEVNQPTSLSGALQAWTASATTIQYSSSGESRDAGGGSGLDLGGYGGLSGGGISSGPVV